jgi:hypothetical protein
LTLQQGEKEAIRAKLLACLQSESLPFVRNKIGDAVAELARQYTDEGMADPEYGTRLYTDTPTAPGEPWPELLGDLFRASQSTDAGMRETAWRIFSTTPGIIEQQHEDVVITAFKTGFSDADTSVC